MRGLPADLDEIRQLAERLAAGGGHARGEAATSSRSFFAVRRA
jgi:hypothetical protein